jgi:hypothetical protein
MNRWQVHFLGTKKLPEDLTSFEMAHFFSFSGEMRREIIARRNASQRIGLAIHVGFLRMTGRSLDAFETIPRVLLRHLGKQFECAARTLLPFEPSTDDGEPSMNTKSGQSENWNSKRLRRKGQGPY